MVLEEARNIAGGLGGVRRPMNRVKPVPLALARDDHKRVGVHGIPDMIVRGEGGP